MQKIEVHHDHGKQLGKKTETLVIFLKWAKNA